MTQPEVTLGEVYRLVQLTREEHGGRLDDILEQARETNGRVNRHEERLRAHDYEIRDLKQQKAAPAPAVARTPASSDAEPGITKRDLKVIVAVLVVLQTLFEWGPRVLALLAGGGS